MATRYWVGGTGSWDSTARWSTSSGGSGGASIPVAGDTVIFDSNSGSGTIQTPKTGSYTYNSLTFDMGSGLNFQTGISWTFSATDTVTVGSGINLAALSGFSVTAQPGGTFSLVTTNTTVPDELSISIASGASWTLSSNTAIGNLSVSGTFNTNDYDLAIANSFDANTSSDVDLGTSTVTVGFAFRSSTTAPYGNSLASSDATIVFTGLTGASSYTMRRRPGNTYKRIEVYGGVGTGILVTGGDGVIQDFYVGPGVGSGGGSIRFTSTADNTVNKITLDPAPGEEKAFRSGTSASQTNVITSSVISFYNTAVRDIDAVNGNWYVVNGTDDGNNNNITFQTLTNNSGSFLPFFL